MKIINENRLKEDVAITIGKFEALHRGHALLIEETVKQDLASAVISFCPSQVLSKPYKPLFSAEEQAFLLEAFGVDYWLPLPFDKELSELSPKEFCWLLQEQMCCRALIVGENFRFGHNREGSPALMQEFGIKTIILPHLCTESGQKISSSQIRDHLAKGQIAEANELLGRPFIIMGTVQKGRQLGRTIGFPTANVHPSTDKFLPPDGVYASWINISGQRKLGVTNIGTNPTVTDEQTRKVETNIFDFDEDIYGEKVVVELCSFIRPEQMFSGVAELKRQIAEDAGKAAKFLCKYTQKTQYTKSLRS